jgi:hypothetical protein
LLGIVRDLQKRAAVVCCPVVLCSALALMERK